MNYYRRYVGDYLRDTARLSMLEHGAYNLLLDYYYAEERPISLDQSEVYRMVRALMPEERRAVDKVLTTFFFKGVDGWHHKRVDHEIWVANKARNNGAKGGRPSTGDETEQETETVTGVQTGTLTGSGHPPTTNHQPPTTNRHKTAGARGARLPQDWQPTEDLKAWAAAKRPDLDFASVVEKFKDHWAAAPGSKGVKLNWDATFRNWVRNESRSQSPAASAVSRIERKCAYCGKRAFGSVCGIWHCNEHSIDAMDQKPLPKVAA